MILYKIIALLIISVIMLTTSYFLNKLSNKYKNKIFYAISFIVKFFVYVFSFIIFFEFFRETDDTNLFFWFSVIVVTYFNNYISLFSKKLNFVMNNNYRSEMLLFLLLILISLSSGNDVLELKADSSTINMVWITILSEQLLNQIITNYKKYKEQKI